MKRTHLAGLLVLLALAFVSCGGDDSNDGSAPAAGTSPAAESEGAQSGAQEQTEERTTTTPGDSGGSTSPPTERKKSGSGSGKEETGDRAASAPRPKRKAKPKTPQEHIAALSPSERRRLHHDLYEQGKQVCYAYGPKELAKNYNLTGADPTTIARQYATLYEAATPSLILPYQQGCMAGFRRHARNPPKAPN